MKPKAIKIKRFYPFSHLKRLQNTKNTQNNISQTGTKMFPLFGLFWRQGLATEARLASNCHSSCLSLLRAGITGMCFHTQPYCDISKPRLAVTPAIRRIHLNVCWDSEHSKDTLQQSRELKTCFLHLSTQLLCLLTSHLQLGAE